MELYFQAWGKFADFNGRAKRSEYWTFVLISGIVSFLLSFISPEIEAIFVLLTIIPHISVSVRRLHDINLSGWWALLFIPTAFPMLIVGFIDSKEEQEINENTKKTLAKAVINHSKELVQEVKPTINNYIEKHSRNDEIVIKNDFKTEDNMIFEDVNEDELYEQVMIEIEEDRKVKSTWAKALSQSDGDDKKAQSLYIKLRVDILVQEKKEQIEIEKKRIKEQEFILKQEQEQKNLTEEQKKLKKLDSFLSNYSVINKLKINDSHYKIKLSNSPINLDIFFDGIEWKIDK
ncbi:DUF805 domain-containing protein [Aliarcobacter cryaerophilus]|uniref:DUF805 domain-containing protein n=1 Tax=Aliarcobacter cryaerophilus TaxID=28198 RepID=UPI0021B652BA|nr:DUF805 domain-containing protein [Aliarcobacter cryaerophilus]MCT7481953.1 DUF805 domain-containing protein [Aliarcobacter cryaerophilus]